MIDPDLKLAIEGDKLLIEGLLLLLCGLELLVRALKFLIRAMKLLVRGSEFFVGGLEVLDGVLKVLPGDDQFRFQVSQMLLVVTDHLIGFFGIGDGWGMNGLIEDDHEHAPIGPSIGERDNGYCHCDGTPGTRDCDVLRPHLEFQLHRLSQRGDQLHLETPPGHINDVQCGLSFSRKKISVGFTMEELDITLHVDDDTGWGEPLQEIPLDEV